MNKLFKIILKLSIGIIYITALTLSSGFSENSTRESYTFSSIWKKHKILINESSFGWTSASNWNIKVHAPKYGIPTQIIIEITNKYKYKYIAWNVSNLEGTGESFNNINWWLEGDFQGRLLPTTRHTIDSFYWVFKPLGVFWGLNRPKLEKEFDFIIVLNGPFDYTETSKPKWVLHLRGLDGYFINTSVPTVFGSSIVEKLEGTVTYIY